MTMIGGMPAGTPALDGQSVLVVEDEFLVAELVCEAVARLGGKVMGPAPSIEAALEMLEAERPDIALLDVNLGGQRVFPLADALWRAHVPFAFTSGYHSGFIEQRFKAVPHLEKPFSTPSLERVLRDLVHAPERELK